MFFFACYVRYQVVGVQSVVYSVEEVVSGSLAPDDEHDAPARRRFFLALRHRRRCRRGAGVHHIMREPEKSNGSQGEGPHGR